MKPIDNRFYRQAKNEIKHSNPTNIDRLLHATRVATGYLCEIDNAGARHITQLLRDATKPWDAANSPAPVVEREVSGSLP